MGTPGKLPDGETLDYLNSVKGLTYREIAEQYGSSINSVYRKVLNYRKTPKQPHNSHVDTLPWKGILAKHYGLHDAIMLRILDDTEKGREVTEYNARALDAWLKKMEQNNWVIDYSRDEGWLRVQRKPEDGNGYVRMPPEGMRRG